MFDLVRTGVVRRPSSLILAVCLLAACLLGMVARSLPAQALVAGPYPDSALFRPDGVLNSAPATVTLTTIGTAAFVAGTDGGIWWSTQAMPWTSLGAPPGGLLGDPAVVSWGPGRIDLFVEGHDNKLWQRGTACSGCQWTGWSQPVGTDGILASAPAVTSWARGRIDVVVQGVDGNFYQRDLDNNAWSAAWVLLGAPAVKATPGEQPAVTTPGPGRLDVFLRGADNKLWQRFLINGSWTGWFQPPGTESGTLAAAPAATFWNGGPDGQVRATVFVHGTDNHLYMTTYDAGWSPWAVQGTPSNFLVGTPEVATTLQFQPYVLVRGTDNLCHGYFPANQLPQHVAVAAAYAAGRSGFASFTLIDTATHGVYSSSGADTQIRTASVIKVPIAMALLNLANSQHRGLTATESSNLHLMITQSDNNAATALWNEVGGSGAVLGLMRSLGATHTSPWPSSPQAWGFTLSTSHDLATVLAQLASGVLGPNATSTILNQMHQVIPSQSWGIAAALPGSAVKNGWFPDPGNWRVNCLGIISGTRYALAVMTQYPIGLGQGYGEVTCQQIAADLFPASAQSPHPGAPVAPVAPVAPETVPAITGVGMTADGG